MNAHVNHHPPPSGPFPAPTSYSTGVAVNQRKTAAIQSLVRWSFLLLVFAIPFETVDLGGGKTVTITKIVGYLFLGAALVLPKRSFSAIPRALIYFGIYLVIFILTGLAVGTPNGGEFASRIWQLVQSLMLFWVSYNLMRDEKTARQAFIAFGLSACLLAVCQRIGLTRVVVGTGMGDRLTALAENSNTVGANFALALLFLVAVTFGRRASAKWQRWAVWPLAALLLTGLISTGSRGALLILATGLFTLLLNGQSISEKVRNVVLLSVLIFLAFHYVTGSDVYTHRWERTIKTGSLSHREDIFPKAWSMFLESPVTGWGPVTNVYELGRRTETERRDTHNLFLWVLTEVGLVGGVPFLAGMGACLWSAVKHRRGAWGAVPLALMLALIVMNLSDTTHNRKIYWIILAFSLAAPIASRVQRRPEGDEKTSSVADLVHGAFPRTSSTSIR